MPVQNQKQVILITKKKKNRILWVQSAMERVIRHSKSDHKMAKYFLKGFEGYGLNALFETPRAAILIV